LKHAVSQASTVLKLPRNATVPVDARHLARPYTTFVPFQISDEGRSSITIEYTWARAAA
jgi:hypothetical protein